ncbi:MAG TPA: YihY/virulence factor BrkB family protein [Desulfomonilia bacterium]|nr:YihY/virulence factor BrkB family protein [Desulfomonilia bacterium]
MKMREMENLADIKLFLKQGIWDVSLKELPWMERHLVSALRVLSITFRKYTADECALRSSALTFFTLMSIVPIAAVAFAIAKGFGFQKLLEQRLMQDMAEHQELVVYVMEFSRRLLETTKGGLLAGAGIIVLLWSVINVLGNIEQSLNNIWGVTRQRPLGRKFSDYLSIMLIAPILMIMSGSATLMVITHLNNITVSLGPGIFTFIITSLIKLIPYCPIWLLLAFLYIFIPNTQVSLSSGFVAGLVAGTVFVIVEKIYIFFQVGVAHYNAIYGSFAALPLFLVMLQISWFVVLFGAELSYAYQNAYACGIELDMSRISPVQKKLLWLSITHHVVVGFEAGSHPLTASDISKVLGLPLILVKRIMNELCETGILIEVVSQGNGKSTYLPAKDTATITVASVIGAQEDHGVSCAGMPIEDYSKDIEGILKEFNRIIEGSDANRLLKDIPLQKN